MRHLARHATLLLLSGTVLASLLASWALARAIDLPDDDEFNVVAWEVRNVPGKWLYLTGRFLRGGLSAADEDERVGRYFVLSAELARAGSADERDEIENEVEAIIEGRLTALLEDVGLESSLPLFPGVRWLWPPVDVEFDEPPRTLALSPRDAIELIGQRHLRPELAVAEIETIEADAERNGGLSALAVPIAGSATYPSIVAPHADYEGLIATIAHEWVHHYLSFKPLGVRYLDSLELQTLNETVADLAGEELAALYVRRYPLPGGAAARIDELSGGAPDVDVDAALHTLRLDVEALLAAGDVEGAEALMERRRLELAGQGIVFRRINQAFFAFRNIYGGDPASIDPIGEKVAALRAGSRSVGAFLRAAAGLRSETDLDRLLGGRLTGCYASRRSERKRNSGRASRAALLRKGPGPSRPSSRNACGVGKTPGVVGGPVAVTMSWTRVMISPRSASLTTSRME